jgi:hypothetical protein
MKTLLIKLFLVSNTALLFSFGEAQDEGWPKTVTASDGSTIKVYEPEPESFSGNTLKFRSAISVTSATGGDPIFGTFWSNSKVETDRNNRMVSIETLQISDIKIPAETDQNRIDFIRTTLESQLPQAMGQIPLDELLSSLDQNLEQTKLSNNISNTPPKVIYTTSPSILVIVDGTPKLQRNNDWGVDVVVNSPFTIVKNTDGQFYLYGSHRWYTAPTATGPYSFAGPNVPQNLSNIEANLNNNASNNNSDNNNGGNNPNPSQATGNPGSTTEDVIPNIVVSTTPAELIQSNGEPNFSPIEGTSLLYMKNSANDIFMDVNSQQYFVLISGRWYKTNALNSNHWQYIAADKLPADFAKIPEGSSKDNVLASVAGTDAAREAVMDAQIPQTAKVDRRTATTQVTYNGEPQFQPVSGTDLDYAVNTSSTVLRYKGQYYAVDNGVWFVSDSPSGPWSVSTERPDEVDKIPPDNPDYNSKYVNVYDVTPDYVYMGYTPGYLNSYVYGPTVVYGTGYYYNPWYGPYYYPRPWSWGFNFGYNPWYGWSFGFGYSFGWFNVGYGWGGWHGGWWGPPVYHPAFCGWHGGYHPYGGFYGRNATVNRTYINNHVTVNNNIYRNRGGVITRDNSRYATSRPATNRPMNSNTGAGNYARTNVNNNQAGMGRPNQSASNVYSDRQGNVYQRGSQGQWQQRSNRQWSPVNNNQHPEVVQNLNRQQQMRDRGQVRAQNFQSARPATVQRSSGGGGGGRSSGGGGGSRRR